MILLALLNVSAGPEIITWPMPLGVPAKAGVPAKSADAIVTENADARIDGLRSSLSLLAVVALIALFATRRTPTEQPTASPASEALT